MNPALIALHVLNKFLVQSLFVSTEYAGSRKNYTHYAMHLIPIAFKILILKKNILNPIPHNILRIRAKRENGRGCHSREIRLKDHIYSSLFDKFLLNNFFQILFLIEEHKE